jgi:hypothetical protein
MILPRGITGFFTKGLDEAPPAVNVKTFTRACHSAAQLEGGSAEQIQPASYPRNYHSAVLRLRDGMVAVLCNAHFPWIAFVAASNDDTHRFLTATALASRFREMMPCEVWDPSLLEGHPNAESLAQLSTAEREQIRYWRPERLGDIIFNAWD